MALQMRLHRREVCFKARAGVEAPGIAPGCQARHRGVGSSGYSESMHARAGDIHMLQCCGQCLMQCLLIEMQPRPHQSGPAMYRSGHSQAAVPCSHRLVQAVILMMCNVKIW